MVDELASVCRGASAYLSQRGFDDGAERRDRGGTGAVRTQGQRAAAEQAALVAEQADRVCVIATAGVAGACAGLTPGTALIGVLARTGRIGFSRSGVLGDGSAAATE
jgi:hypothetical protein